MPLSIPVGFMSPSFRISAISRPESDDHTSLMNSVAPGPLKGFEPKLAQIFTIIVGSRTDYVFKVMSFKGQGHRKHFQTGKCGNCELLPHHALKSVCATYELLI